MTSENGSLSNRHKKKQERKIRVNEKESKVKTFAAAMINDTNFTNTDSENRANVHVTFTQHR